MRFAVATALLVCLATSAFAKPKNGMPFGKITDEDVEALGAFSRSKGYDLLGDIDKAYEKKDAAALGRVFQFSTEISSLDRSGRAYGQIIYSSFLNLGEEWGVERYAKVIDAQKPDVQQRIRDFILYPLASLPEKKRNKYEKSHKKDYPEVFPPGYRFGRDNPLIPKPLETTKKAVSPSG